MKKDHNQINDARQKKMVRQGLNVKPIPCENRPEYELQHLLREISYNEHDMLALPEIVHGKILRMLFRSEHDC